MKKLFVFFFCVISYSGIFSQSLSHQVVATAGDHFVGTDVQMSWTIGELSVETLQSDSLVLTQGFHQPNLVVTSVEDLARDISVDIYPNPTADIVNIKLNDDSAELNLELSGNTGQILMTKKSLTQGSINQFDLSRFAGGVYLLRLVAEDGQTIKTFKIIKSN